MRLDDLTPAADEFLRGTRLAVVAEAGDPYPHAVPVWFEWTGDAIEFFTRPERPKVDRLRVAPSVSVLVSAEVAEPVYWVRIEGQAEFFSNAAPLVNRMCDRYLDDTDPSHQALGADIRGFAEHAIGVRIVPERIWHFAG